MSAIIANIERIKQTENNLRNQYSQYLSVCNAIEREVTSLRNWHGFEKFIMDQRVRYGIIMLKSRARVLNDNADYLNRWRVNILYAQSTMLNRIRYLR